MEKLRCCNFLESSKPYIAMISLQFGYAGLQIITKVSLNRGMSHYVLVVYRHAFATAAIAPFALIFERRSQPKITFPVFMRISIMALLGPVIDQNFCYAGLKYTSPTFSCALSNVLPAMTFVMAIICSPLAMIIVAIMDSFILAEKIFLGVVIGAVLIVVGLYSVLWVKHKENKEKEVEEGEIPEPINVSQANGIGNTILMIEDIEANDAELQKTEENNKVSSIAIAMPMPESPKKPNQEQK